MATAAISAEYLYDAEDFADELLENGYLCSFGVHAEGAETWLPPGDYVETGEAAVFPSEWQADFSSDVRKDDVMLFVAARMKTTIAEFIPMGEFEWGVDPFGGYREFYGDGASKMPKNTHMIDADGVKREIIEVKQFKPDGITTIYYEIQVR